MNIKLFEIRDKATFILALAVDMNPTRSTADAFRDSDHNSELELRALRRCGYPCDGAPNILLTRLDGGSFATNDPYYWRGRTFPVAHDHIIKNWNTLESGAVIDVEFILGQSAAIKESEL